MQSHDIAPTDGNKVGRYHIFISALSICCFYNSLQNGLVHDDVFAIINNEDIRSETPITNVFINDFWGRNLQDEKSHKSFRPLCTLTFRLNYMLHGLHPYGYHVTNILLHTAVSNLFFYILYKVIFLDLLPSVVASMIFTTHPVHVEAVTGIVGRGDVLSCLLFLLAFLNYVRHLQKHVNSIFSYNFLLSILCGTACLFVKEHSVTVFGVCAVYDVIKNKTSLLRLLSLKKKRVKSNPVVERKKSDTFSSIPVIGRILFLSVWVVLLFAFRLQVMGKVPTFLEEDNPASFSPHLMTRILTYLYLLAFNSLLLIAPITLCYDWQVGSIPLVEYITDLRNIETVFFLAVMIYLFAVAVVRIIKDSNQEIPLIGLTFLVIPFLPASNFFLRVGFVVAERILYISSMGYCILIGYGFTLIIRYFTRCKVNKGLLAACYFIFGLLILLFSVKTIKYNTVWYSRETLFRSGVETLPHNAKAHYNYANFLKDVNSSKEEAIYHYKQAVRLYPSHSSAHNNLGSLLSDEEAEYHYVEALKYTPGHYRAMFNLGGVYWRMKRFKDAELVLLEALRYSPDYFDAQNLLVEVLKENKKYVEAKAVYKKMISADKSKIDLLLKYATFLNDIGEFQESVDVTAQILSEDSKNYAALCNMAKIYERTGNSKQSIRLYERAISINRNELSGYHGLAFHHISKHDMQAANEVYERSLKHVQPTREHLRNYAAVLYQLEKYEKAIGILENLLIKHKDFFLARTTLIGFLVDMKDKRVEQLIASSLELYPKDEGIRLHLADWKRSNMQYEEAKQVYLEIISQNPKNAKALQSLGTIYHIQNDLVNTEKYYDLAHRLNPTDENLIENIKKLRRLQSKAHN